MHKHRFLFSTLALHRHAQNIALALHELEVLGRWQTCGLDYFPRGWKGMLRKYMGKSWPEVNSLLNNRQLYVDLPQTLIDNRIGWEGFRMAAKRIPRLRLLEDWMWQQSEFSLERQAVRRLKTNDYTAFIGTEFGSLGAIRQAREAGKQSVVIFSSPHHSVYKTWVEPQLADAGSTLSETQQVLLEKGIERNRRRDAEMYEADFIHTNSSFAMRSLVSAGIPRGKVAYSALGSPPGISPEQVESDLRHFKSKMKFIFAGSVSIHKGAHLLLTAWKQLNPVDAELHFYGNVNLSKAWKHEAISSVYFHGPVPRAQLFSAFRRADLLVFPTLFDGFGQVIAESLAHGCPVLTTLNAGAADLIREDENGWVIPPASVSALEQRLAWCRENQASLRAMRFACAETAERHSWQQFRQQFKANILEWFRLPQTPSGIFA